MLSDAANRLAAGHTRNRVVGIGRRFMGIEEHVAVRCLCCDATDVDNRPTRICPRAICPRAGAQVNQHQLLLHAIDLSHSQAAWGPSSSRER